MTRTDSETKSAQRKYMKQRCRAYDRGIDFLLTYEEWQQWWDDSGHWDERGVKSHHYVMARLGDVGAYALDNIECITVSQNIRDARYNDVSNTSNTHTPKQAPTGIVRIAKPKKIKPPKPILTDEEQKAKWLATTLKGNETKRKNKTFSGGCPVGTKRTLETRAKCRQSALNRKSKTDKVVAPL